MDTSGMEISPVAFIQDRELQLGSHRFRYSIDTAGVPGKELQIYLLRCPGLYQRPGIYTAGGDEHLRFMALSCAAIEMCQHMGFAPDIFHCHDWHTALIPLLLKTRYAWDRLFERTRTVLTIHNIGYQGIFNARIVAETGLGDFRERMHQEDLALGRVNFLKTGVLYADLLTTVSPTYAREILEPEYGMGLQDLLKQRTDTLVGILNGVDFDEWNPESDPLIPHAYNSRRLAGKKKNKLALMKELEIDPGDDLPLVGMVTRLTYQKGIELVQKVVPQLLAKRRFALAVLGSGEPRYEQFFTWLQHKHRDRVCYYRGFNNQLAHWIEAGADLFLMPSRFEPCGLNQMYSLRYGTVPIVRRTGGLADSVQLFEPSSGKGTGIVFDEYNEVALNWALNAGLDLYQDSLAQAGAQRHGHGLLMGAPGPGLRGIVPAPGRELRN
jgi:starch synthase